MNDAFWAVVRDSCGDPESLKAILRGRSTEEVLAFAQVFNQCLIHLNKWEVWGAGYVISGEMSDGTNIHWVAGIPVQSANSFRFFRCWIIGKGREAYETALATPDKLGDFVAENEEIDNELLEEAAIEVLAQRGLPDPREKLDCPDGDLQGQEWDEDDLDSLYPRLTARFS